MSDAWMPDWLYFWWHGVKGRVLTYWHAERNAYRLGYAEGMLEDFPAILDMAADSDDIDHKNSVLRAEASMLRDWLADWGLKETDWDGDDLDSR